jgi:NMD protein affecting ribosome stability and mRNA decay
MDTRKLRIVKPPLPAIGVCEGCNSQFKSNKRSEDEVEAEIRAAFESHKCKLMDESRNAQRVERDFTEDG